MAIVDIPKSPDDLSPEWLTAALQSGGAGNARVASFDYEPIAAGVGFLGKLGRLRLRYAEGGEGLPRTLVVKQPTQDAKSRQLAMMFRFYEREVCFYREVGSAAGIRIPTMHFGAPLLPGRRHNKMSPLLNPSRPRAARSRADNDALRSRSRAPCVEAPAGP